MHAQHFYVYLLMYPDGISFYVGKGTGKRVFDHEREAGATPKAKGGRSKEERRPLAEVSPG